jgi:hypothetical protein
MILSSGVAEIRALRVLACIRFKALFCPQVPGGERRASVVDPAKESKEAVIHA